MSPDEIAKLLHASAEALASLNRHPSLESVVSQIVAYAPQV